MVNEKPGETVAAYVENRNEAGQVISRTTHEMFGFDNTGANVTAETVVMAVMKTITDFIDVKSAGAAIELRRNFSGSGEAKQRR